MANSVSTRIDKHDAAFMRAALNIAARGLGRVAPNPAVGCILVKEGRVVGRGWTQPGGRPHAERKALEQAGSQANGACAYVTLEPCSHYGKTSPCADALIEAGIARCVVALQDPDDRVQGRGIEKLRAAGITVETGVCEAAARELNEGFLRRITQGRPMVTLKAATSLDGRIATRSGASQWITGPAARQRGHLLRATHDAILVGSGTAVADNPRLDVRLPGLAARSPQRVVVDGRLRLPLDGDLVVRAREQATVVFTRPGGDEDKLAACRAAGLEVVELGAAENPLPLDQVFQALGARGITRLLVEGGSEIAGALMAADLIDRIHWFRAAGVIGGDGLPAIAGFRLDFLQSMPKFTLRSSIALAEDRLEVFHRQPTDQMEMS